MIQTADYKRGRDNSVVLHDIREKIAFFEDDFPTLKEATSILELALWNMKMNENIFQQKTIHYQKKIKADESCIRSQNRVACGADVVILHRVPTFIIYPMLPRLTIRVCRMRPKTSHLIRRRIDNLVATQYRTNRLQILWSFFFHQEMSQW